MAIWCLNKTIAYGSTITAAALVYYIIILNNRKGRKKTDEADNNRDFEIKITDSCSPNKHNEKQIFDKNSVNQNNTPELSKDKRIVSPKPKQNTFNNSRKPLGNKKLHQIQLKAIEYYNSIIHNSARFFTHNKSSDKIILNSTSSFEHKDNQDNLKHPFVIYINNSVDSTSNRIQIKVFKSIKLNIKTSDDPSTDSSLIMISQKSESKEIDIIIPSFSRQRVVERIMTPRGDRLMNAHNNKCTKEIETNNVTIIINASM